MLLQKKTQPDLSTLIHLFASGSDVPQQYECDVVGEATNLPDSQQAVGHCAHRCAWNVPTLQRYPPFTALLSPSWLRNAGLGSPLVPVSASDWTGFLIQTIPGSANDSRIPHPLTFSLACSKVWSGSKELAKEQNVKENREKVPGVAVPFRSKFE